MAFAERQRHCQYYQQCKVESVQPLPNGTRSRRPDQDLGHRDDAAVVGPRGWLEAAPKDDSLGFAVFQRVRSAANFAQPEMLHGMGIGWTAFLDRALRKTEQLAVPMMECG
jgi:hypothetical protein